MCVKIARKWGQYNRIGLWGTDGKDVLDKVTEPHMSTTVIQAIRILTYQMRLKIVDPHRKLEE